jgi:DNA-binding PadR family transcriptional regulator
LKVLGAFLEDPSIPLAGSDIWRKKGVGSGALYPILARLQKADWLTSEWEGIDPTITGRPCKRLYRLTAVGELRAREAFREAFKDVTPLQEQLGWAF